MKKILSLLLIVFLTACGGSGGDDNSSVGTGVSPAVAISASDTLDKINRSTETTTNMGVVDVSGQVVSSDGSALTLMNVEPLNSSTEARCQVDQINDLNFVVKADDIGSCFYTYTVATPSGNATSSATSVISVQDVSGASALTLPTITASVSDINTPLTIDYVTELGVDYPTGSELDESALVVQGSGTVSYDAINDKLIFTGTDGGLSRIYYTLNDYSMMVSYIGVIEVAVSDPNSVTSTLEATDIALPATGDAEIEMDVETTIDVASYVTSNIYQSNVQLIGVSSFTADVAPVDASDLTNTKFTFKASIFGSHTVTYTVSDQHGSYAIATAVINVAKDDSDPGEIIKLDWAAITIEDPTIKDDITFLATPSKSIADYMTDPYMSYSSENGITGPLGAEVVKMNYYQAQAYCKKYDARLPLTRELASLYSAASAEGGVYAEHNWPTGQPYWTAEQTSVAGQTSIYDLAAGISSTADSSTGTAYVTCVDLSSGVAADYSITGINQIPAQGTTTEFSLTVLDPDGSPAAYKEILLSTEFTRGSFRLESTESLQDEMYVSANANGVINFDYLDVSLNDEVVLIDVSSARFKDTFISESFDKITINVTDADKWNRIATRNYNGIGLRGISLFNPGYSSSQSSNVYKEGQIGKDWLAYYVTYSENLNTNFGRFSFFIQQDSDTPESSWLSINNNPLPHIDDVFAVMVDMYSGTTAIKFGYTDTSATEDTDEVKTSKIYQWFEKRGDTLYYYYSEDTVRPKDPKYTVPFTWPGIEPDKEYWVGFSSSVGSAKKESYVVSGGFAAY